jgi:phage terminase large subunit-like protein
VQAIAQSFLNPGQIGVTVLGNMDKFKLVREDLAKLRPGQWLRCHIALSHLEVGDRVVALVISAAV